MRRKIYEVIEKSDGNNKLSSIYDFAMIIIIVMSLALPAGIITAGYMNEIDKEKV